MSADLVERTRAVTTRLSERDPTKWKSARERLRTIWQLGFREGRTVGGPSRTDTVESVRKRLSKIWQAGFREGRNVGGPSRTDTGRHDPSNKTQPDKVEVSSRET